VTPVNTWFDSAVAWPQAGLAILLSAGLKASVVLGGAGLLALLLRRSSASARHLVWSAGMVVALLLPAVSFVLPAWRISLPMPALELAQEPVVLGPAGTPTGPLALAAPPSEPGVTPERLATVFRDESIAPARSNWSSWLLLFWLAGALTVFAGLILSMLRVRRLQRRTHPVMEGPCVDAIRRLAGELQLTRVPRLHVGDEQDMPMVWGLFRPVLLLPAGAARWSPVRLRAVILHELAHVRRRDALTQLLAELARAVYWFNPLAWLAARRLNVEREHACDDMVLNAGTRASDYAAELLDLVRSLRATRATALAAIAMARPAQLKLRLYAVLDDARNRRTVTPALIVRCVLLAFVLGFPLAAFQPLVQEARAVDMPILSLTRTKAQSPSADAQRSAPARTAKTTRPVAGPVVANPAGQMFFAVASAAVQDSCGLVRNRSTNHNTDDGVETIKWSRGRCSGAVRMEGTVRFTDDFAGIASISSGGLFRIEEDDGQADRRLEVRPAGARLQYSYRVNGREAEFDASGRAWLSRALVNLARTTGFAAEQRVTQLLRSGGPEAVLAEVRLLSSDYAKSIYLRTLLQRSALGPAQVKASIDLAGREVESDYELARILIALADKHPFDDQTRRAFIAATGSIQSDYEHKRVLAKALAKGDLRSTDVAAMLMAAQNISSDYERASLLIGVSERYKLDPATRAAYLDVARGINSDYEQRRVYESLLKQGDLNRAEAAELLRAAEAIRSDYEKSQVLSQLVKSDLSDPAVQTAFLSTLRGMSSSHEKSQVLTKLLGNGRLSEANLSAALRAAATIESDYEAAQVLILVLKNQSLNAEQKELFMKALNTIASEHEYGRVAGAFLRQHR
jgi:beta-lactamase regulating signal transducer with metallopeptidase domain